jgi:hypothetical protein
MLARKGRIALIFNDIIPYKAFWSDVKVGAAMCYNLAIREKPSDFEISDKNAANMNF